MSHTDPLTFDAIHVDTLRAIVKPTDHLVTVAQAKEILSAPSGSRPRMYGLMLSEGNYQVVKLASFENLERLKPVAQWLSGTTYADLISKA